MAIGQSQFPSQLDTLDTLVRVSNDAATTLSAALDAAATVAQVSDTSTFPSSGSLVIEDEVLFYNAKTPDSFTGLERGRDGSSAAAHPLGVEVELQIVAVHHSVLSEATINTQTYARSLADRIAALESASPEVATSAHWDARTNTQATNVDPGAGKIVWNTLPTSSATEIAIDNLTSAGVDTTLGLSQLTTGDAIFIQAATDSSRYQKWEITGTTAATGFHRFTVSLVSSAGADFAANLDLLIVLRKATASSAAPRRPGFYHVSDYGASGSRLTSAGTLTLAQNKTLTLSAGHDFKVGQGLGVPGAGAAGSLLVTKITALSGNVATLRDAASTAVSGAAVQHDDTEAIQSAIQACFDAKGGTVEFEYGFYRVNGPINPATNSILFIPHNPYDLTVTGQNIPFRLKGQGWQIAPLASQYVGTVIQSDRIGVDWQSSILSCDPMIDNFEYDNGNTCGFVFEDISFVTYPNPRLSGLDCGMCFNVILKNVTIGITGYWGPDPPEPTYQNFALRLPRGRLATVVYCEQVCVANYWTGVIFSELMNANQLTVFNCKVGLEKRWGDHLNHGMLCIVHCPSPIKCIDSPNAALGTFDFTVSMENLTAGSGGWRSLVRHIDDPANKMGGRIGYINFEFAPAQSFPDITYTGCEHVVFTNYATGDLHSGAIESKAITSSAEITGASLALAGDAQVSGVLRVRSGAQLQPFSFGANDSAGAGFREARVPNDVSTNLAVGLVSYWKLDALVASGSQPDAVGPNTLTLSGTMYDNFGPPGEAQSHALQLTDSARISAPDSPSLNFSAGGLIIAGWIYFTSLAAPNQFPALVGKWGAADGTYDYVVFYHSTAGKWSFQISPTGTSAGAVTCALTETAVVNQWYFVAAVYDEVADQLRISVNAGTPATEPSAGPIFHSAQPLNIGRFADAYSAAAVIDEIGLWNRALTGAEIAALYNNGEGRTYPFS